MALYRMNQSSKELGKELGIAVWEQVWSLNDDCDLKKHTFQAFVFGCRNLNFVSKTRMTKHFEERTTF